MLGRWRVRMAAFVVFCIAVWLAGAPHLFARYEPEKAGVLGVALGPVEPGRRQAIVALDERSPLFAAGARAGDAIVFDHPGDGWRRPLLDESIDLTLVRGDAREHLRVQAVADPGRVAHAAAVKAIWWLLLAQTMLDFLIGGLLAWRQAGSAPMRALACVFLSSELTGGGVNWPRGAIGDYVQPVVYAIGATIYFVGIVYFALTYPVDRPLWRASWARRTFAIFTLFVVAYWFVYLLFWRGELPTSLVSFIYGNVLYQGLVSFVTAAVALPALWLSWREATGVTRQRIAWFGSTLLIQTIANMLLWGLGLIFTPSPYTIALYAIYTGCLAVAGWALLRHRLIDVGFALNRLCVYAVVALSLVVVAIGAQVVLSVFLDLSAHVLAGGLATAAAMMLLLPSVRRLAEAVVQRALYPRWRSFEARLRSDVAAADRVQGREALIDHYLRALAAYTNGASGACYEARGDEGILIAGDLAGAPAVVPMNDERAARIVTGRLPRNWRGWVGEYGAVVPILHRDRLDGWLVMGDRPDGHQYRPDELRAIDSAVRKLDEDLQADTQRVNRRLLEDKAAAEQRAREAAESANEAKSSFLATMSHEIRTPMNGVIGMSGILLDSTLTEDQRDVATTIRDSGEALLTIINDILDFSKIEAGKMDVESHPFELRPCIESALDLVRPRAIEKGIDLVSTVDATVPVAISGDSTRLRQILLNLLSNAVKFTERGAVSLTVRYADGDLDVAVRDSGIGLSPEGIARLFKRFGQAEASTTRQFGGTGLGLVISKRLAELMGGTITVDSEGAGQGSTFRFGIRAPVATLAPRAVAAKPAVDPAMAERHPLRILLAEDNVVNQKLAMRLLKQMGYDADLVENGADAVAAVERQPYDVVLMDVQMPEMDGLEASRRIHARWSNGPRPRIVAMTANAMQGDREVCLAAGMDDYLAKPIRVDQLIDALKAATALGHSG